MKGKIQRYSGKNVRIIENFNDLQKIHGDLALSLLSSFLDIGAMGVFSGPHYLEKGHFVCSYPLNRCHFNTFLFFNKFFIVQISGHQITGCIQHGIKVFLSLTSMPEIYYFHFCLTNQPPKNPLMLGQDALPLNEYFLSKRFVIPNMENLPKLATSCNLRVS